MRQLPMWFVDVINVRLLLHELAAVLDHDALVVLVNHLTSKVVADVAVELSLDVGNTGCA